MAPAAPVAARRPVSSTVHGLPRLDEYAWLRDRSDPDVVAYLEAENTYTESVMAPWAGLRDGLYEEIKSRVQETDLSVPIAKGPFEYFTRTEEGCQYGIHCRRARGVADAPDTILLDENVLAEGHEFFSLGSFELSPDHRLVAYSVDTEGDEVFTSRVRDLATGLDLDDVLEGTGPGAAWSGDTGVLFYVTLDDSMRPWRLWRHELGTAQAKDVCVFQEDDDRFYLSVGATTTERFVIMSLHSQVTTEAWLLDAHEPYGDFSLVEARRQDVEYSVDHHRAEDGSERLFIVTNDGAENFRLMVAPLASPSREHWVEVVLPAETADDERPKLDGVEVLQRYMALFERADGNERIRILALQSDGTPGALHTINQPEPVYSLWGAGNVEFETRTLRFGYSSPVTPASIFDYDLESGGRVLRKQQPVLGGFDPQHYVCERTWANADDGTRVPISLVRRKDVAADGRPPCVLYGYGAYEISMDPTFSSARLSLLDRGFVYAIAHVRGGGELGRRWYREGKFLCKRNSFTDFVACAEHLIAAGYAAPDRLVARGGSAGGLLMGAVSNLRPDLFRAVVAEVPFVDVVNTMLDDALPLTVIEWEEWGNPADPEYFDYMRSYAPYENVAAVRYPELLVTAGLNDPRVGFWEPAKWVAKLRAVTQTNAERRLLLRTEMGAGHGGPSGRYRAWRDEAFVLSFIVTSVGLSV